MKQDKASFTHKIVVNLYIIYELGTWSGDFNTKYKLGDCFLGAVKLTKNADPDKYRYIGYGIGFDARSLFSLPNGEWGKNIVIFGVGYSSSLLTENSQKISKLLMKIQATDWMILKYQQRLNILPKKICLNLYYNRSRSFSYANGLKAYRLKAKDYEIKQYLSSLGIIKKYLTVDNMKKLC